MFTFLEMLPLIVSESSVDAYISVSYEACGAPLRLAALVRRPLPSPDWRNNSVHVGCSCGPLVASPPPPPPPWRTFLYRLHVCNFHTGIFACVVDNIFINFFHRSLRTSRFLSFFKTIFSPFLFHFYHGDQTIWRTLWRICCIWQSVSIQYVQI